MIINGVEYEYVEQQQEEHYKNRIGKTYGDYEVIDVSYDADNRRQEWTLRCKKCGNTIITHNGKDFAKGKNKGNCQACKEAARKAKAAAEKKAREESAPKIPKKQKGWTVLDHVKYKGYRCRCEKCGNERYFSGAELERGDINECRCANDYSDLKWIGERFGNLTVMKHIGGKFECQCDCGRVIKKKCTFLLSGKTVTCADKDCEYRIKRLTESAKTHGGSHERLYGVWIGMLDRCKRPYATSYKYYGARGITVCKEWEDYNVFREWALKNGYDANAPLGKCTIDRINNDGNYEPDNCRWVDMAVQASNKRPGSPRKLKTATIHGVTKTLRDWYAESGVTSQAVYYRMNVRGMSLEEALFAEKEPGRPKIKSR